MIEGERVFEFPMAAKPLALMGPTTYSSSSSDIPSSSLDDPSMLGRRGTSCMLGYVFPFHLPLSLPATRLPKREGGGGNKRKRKGKLIEREKEGKI